MEKGLGLAAKFDLFGVGDVEPGFVQADVGAERGGGQAVQPLVVPAVSAEQILFAPLAFEPEMAAQEARRGGVWVQPAFADQVWPAEDRLVRPLMPLRRGHLALLIAAGLLV